MVRRDTLAYQMYHNYKTYYAFSKSLSACINIYFFFLQFLPNAYHTKDDLKLVNVFWKKSYGIGNS